ncbi:hypothetical protein SESI111939_15435 [Serratia silvae]
MCIGLFPPGRGNTAETKKPESDPGNNYIAELFCTEPIVGTFPGFLEYLLDQVFICFGTA